MKRLLQDIITVNGDLDSDAYACAVLQYRNTLDPDNGISPAQILFGRPIRDMLPFKPNSQVFDHNMIKPLWKTIWDKRQQTLVNRSDRQIRELNHHTKLLPNLATGDQCRVQNQCGQFPGRWDRTGKIVEAKNHDQYLVKLDGSNRLTLRNRKFIRKADAPTLVIPPPIDSCPTLVPEATSDEPQNQTPLTDTSCQSDSSNTLPPINPDHSESDRQNVVDQPPPSKTVEPTTSRPTRIRNPPT